MALDATEIHAGVGEQILIAATSATMPTTLAASPAGFSDLGYVSEDGVTFASQPQFRDQKAWQSLRPIGKKKTGVEESLTFGLMQLNTANLRFAFGAAAPTEASAVFTMVPPSDTASPDYRALVVDWGDSGNTYRLVFPKVLLTGSIELALKAEEDTIIPCELSIFQPDSGSPWSFITDDTNFDPTP